MNSKDLKILKGLITIIEQYDRVYNDTDSLLLLGLTRIINDAAFEAKHPRDKYGKFTDKNISKEFRIYPQNLPEGLKELTSKELECLYVAAADCNNHEIAKEMIITVHTVKAHLGNIYQKLRATGRLDAVVKGLNLELLDMDIVNELRDKYNERAKQGYYID